MGIPLERRFFNQGFQTRDQLFDLQFIPAQTFVTQPFTQRDQGVHDN